MNSDYRMEEKIRAGHAQGDGVMKGRRRKMTATSEKSNTSPEEEQSKKRKEAGRVIDRESSSLRGKNSKITTLKNKIKH